MWCFANKCGRAPICVCSIAYFWTPIFTRKSTEGHSRLFRAGESWHACRLCAPRCVSQPRRRSSLFFGKWPDPRSLDISAPGGLLPCRLHQHIKGSLIHAFAAVTCYPHLAVYLALTEDDSRQERRVVFDVLHFDIAPVFPKRNLP